VVIGSACSGVRFYSMAHEIALHPASSATAPRKSASAEYAAVQRLDVVRLCGDGLLYCSPAEVCDYQIGDPAGQLATTASSYSPKTRRIVSGNLPTVQCSMR